MNRLFTALLLALASVAGLVVLLAVPIFLFIGGPGAVHGFIWIATHPRLEWLPDGTDRVVVLEEMPVPAAPPTFTEPLSELYFPDGRGLSEGGKPLQITRRPGSSHWVGVNVVAPIGGLVLDAERQPIEPFALDGAGRSDVLDVFMPTTSTLLVLGTERRPDATYARTLDEYDFERKSLLRRITDDIPGYGVRFARLNETTALVVYGTGSLAMGINMVRPQYSTFRLYGPRGNEGADVLRMSYGIGAVEALRTESDGRVSFLTRFDHALSVYPGTARSWTLTLR